MSSDTTETKDESSPHILCLSGGGLRATFYHLGVVRLLAKTGWLKKVTHVFSVSGGSILAAHMALNWESYAKSDDDEFQRVTGELIKFGQLDVRGRILRRWIPFLLGRTRLFQRSLSTLYNSAKLGQLPEMPKFHFLATSLTSGQLCSFSKDQWTAISATRRGPNFAGVKSDYLELSRVVAASAAFPPMFPPVRIRATGLDPQGEALFHATHYLTDGGIFDNLGLAGIFHILDNFGMGPEPADKPIMKGGFGGLGGSPQRASYVIVSDASASFDEAKGNSFASIVSRTSRVTEIMMSRLALRDIRILSQEMQEIRGKEYADNRVIHLPIRHGPISSFEVKPGSRYETQSATIQHGIRYVRTDLDRFDPKLIWYLMRHGHDVAASAMRGLDADAAIDALKPRPDLPADSAMENEEQLERFMESQKARFRKDNLYGLVSLPYGLIGTVMLLLFAVWILYSVFTS